MSKIYFNKQDLGNIMKRVERYENGTKHISDELESTLKKALKDIKRDFPTDKLAKQYKGVNRSNIKLRKSAAKDKVSFTLSAGTKNTGKYYAYTEFGTRGKGISPNPIDAKQLLGARQGEEISKRYKRPKINPIGRLEPTPFFFKNIRKNYKGFGKRLFKRLKGKLN